MAVLVAAFSGRTPAGTAAVGAAVLVGQLSIGWHNDFLDAERDAMARRSDKPITASLISRNLVGRAAATAAVLVVPLSYLSGWRAGSVHLVAVASGLAYNARLKATPLSLVPFAVSFGLLPAFVTLGGQPSVLPPWWVCATGALLGVGAHLTNALPDLDDDLAAGIAGLPHRLGWRRSLVAAATSLLAASALLAIGPAAWSWWRVASLAGATLLVAAILVASRSRSSRLPFALTLALAVLDVAALVANGHRLG